MNKLTCASDLFDLRQEILSHSDPKKVYLAISSGSCGLANGAAGVIEAFEKELKNANLEDKVELKRTGCRGFCDREPMVNIYPQDICYLSVKESDVSEIVQKTLVENVVVKRLLYIGEDGQEIQHDYDIPFYSNQTRVVFGNNIIDPWNIEDFLAIGGYSALAKALTQMTPEQVLDEVKKSNIRGRGGAGFPTGKKWEETRNALSDIKYVIVNADEGDPGAYKDRVLLEGNPHSILEGLTIGGYAIGAHEGFIYVRQEYPLAVENVLHAIEVAEEFGLLGENILGSGFSFKVTVHRGAGAFVSGESSALMTAIEGRVGEPRPKYTHTSTKGVWDRPSDLNNVETWANIPLIVNKGSDWFRQYGTEGSKGTKIFSLVGKVNNTGLAEVPMGMSLRDIVYKIGGGIANGKKFKAVQTGGPSGGCIPAELLDLRCDYDELSKAGSMMGSGGMIVMDEDTCMVDVARYFLDFLSDESCGKCVPCREGIRQMLKILTRITTGKGKDGDIELLEELADVTKSVSLCALGKSAPNPVLSTLRYFREEYEAHIREKRCPALACKELIKFEIDPEKCKSCMICLRKCPAEAIVGGKGVIHVINQEKCTKCGTCIESCPPRFGAVKKVSGVGTKVTAAKKEELTRPLQPGVEKKPAGVPAKILNQ